MKFDDSNKIGLIGESLFERSQNHVHARDDDTADKDDLPCTVRQYLEIDNNAD